MIQTSMPLITLELPFFTQFEFRFDLFFNEEGFDIFLLCFIIINDVISRDLFHSVYLFICIFSFLFEQMYRASFGPVTLRGHALFLCCFFLLVY